ncbi:acyltransferase [Paraglaciecola aquimarina]|uniref:Acyltransferase n=1 Tax=Paraglaciecola aquimarina TaxID=1235557 RepID=A0ABU3T2A4_9ALTE|nr:acyltransferase [Paraglaciecola aquimarina]MDU0356368.1 acyltransferase [Paraglaciecola aquimarina]
MSQSQTILSLTSIRSFAALFVVWYHVAVSFTAYDFTFFNLFLNGSLSVDLFFVLSGFILHHVYKDKNIHKSYRKFVFTRLARIYPLHLVTLLTLLFITLVLDDFSDRYNPEYYTGLSFFLNLLLVQNWGFIPPSWNMVSWSISAEWFMYLLFPFMVCGVSRFKLAKTQKVYPFITLFVLASHYLAIYTLQLDGYGGMSIGGMIQVFFEFSLGFFFME